MAFDGRASGPGDIFLNGRHYRCLDIQEKESSILPEKQVFGDWTKASDPVKSTVVFNDWRGGVGLWSIDSPDDANRSWYSEGQTRWKGHLIPQFEVSNTNDLSPANSSAIAFIIESDVNNAVGTNSIYAAFGDTIYIHEDTNQSWTSELDTNATIYDAITVDLAGVSTLAVATSDGYSYKQVGGSWTTDTTNANQRYLAAWNESLWMIDNTGRMRYVSTIGTEVADAKLRLPLNSVTGMFVGPDASGADIIYVATTTGLYSHDFLNNRLVKTKLVVPENANAGKGHCVWGRTGNIYFSSNMRVLEYDPVRGGIRDMGLDKEDGLPAKNRGVIKQMVDGGDELLALVDCSATTNGFTAIWGWDGVGWEAKTLDPTAGGAYAADYLYVASCYSSYRMWFGGTFGDPIAGTTRRVRYRKLPTDRLNPDQIGTQFAFCDRIMDHYTPWFSGGQDNVDKIALKCKVDVSIPDATDALYIYYMTDWNTATTTIAGPVTAGPVLGARVLEYDLPPSSVGNPLGVAFRGIQLLVTMNPGPNTSMMDLHSVTLEWVPKLRVKRQWRVVLDITNTYDGRTAIQQRDNLTTALGAQTLVEFAWRKEAGTGVLVFQEGDKLTTGRDEKGLMTLLLIEP